MIPATDGVLSLEISRNLIQRKNFRLTRAYLEVRCPVPLKDAWNRADRKELEVKLVLPPTSLPALRKGPLFRVWGPRASGRHR